MVLTSLTIVITVGFLPALAAPDGREELISIVINISISIIIVIIISNRQISPTKTLQIQTMQPPSTGMLRQERSSHGEEGVVIIYASHAFSSHR